MKHLTVNAIRGRRTPCVRCLPSLAALALLSAAVMPARAGFMRTASFLDPSRGDLSMFNASGGNRDSGIEREGSTELFGGESDPADHGRAIARAHAPFASPFATGLFGHPFRPARRGLSAASSAGLPFHPKSSGAMLIPATLFSPPDGQKPGVPGTNGGILPPGFDDHSSDVANTGPLHAPIGPIGNPLQNGLLADPALNKGIPDGILAGFGGVFDPPGHGLPNGAGPDDFPGSNGPLGPGRGPGGNGNGNGNGNGHGNGNGNGNGNGGGNGRGNGNGNGGDDPPVFANPEPASLALFGIGLLGVLGFAARAHRNHTNRVTDWG